MAHPANNTKMEIVEVRAFKVPKGMYFLDDDDNMVRFNRVEGVATEKDMMDVISDEGPSVRVHWPDGVIRVVTEYQVECGNYAEAHEEHMRINGDCPWCGSFDISKWL